MAEKTYALRGFSSQNEANKFRDLLGVYFRPEGNPSVRNWSVFWRKLVLSSLRCEKTPVAEKMHGNDRWMIVHTKTWTRPFKDGGYLWSIHDFCQRAEDFVQGYRAAEKMARKQGSP